MKNITTSSAVNRELSAMTETAPVTKKDYSRAIIIITVLSVASLIGTALIIWGVPKYWTMKTFPKYIFKVVLWENFRTDEKPKISKLIGIRRSNRFTAREYLINKLKAKDSRYEIELFNIELWKTSR
jgi:hypothetical protein